MRLPWHIVEPLDGRTFAEVRRAAIFECCKWDPQVEDVCAMSALPVVLTQEAWAELVVLAEQLARETLLAESAILQKRQCLGELGLPWSLRRRLRGLTLPEGGQHHLRLIRFDFHFTTEGWRISEANSDVPGGFSEASGFTRLMSDHYRRAVVPCDPMLELTRAIRDSACGGDTVALVHATAFTDDRQVMVQLARHLKTAGMRAVLVGPDQLRWNEGRAFVDTDWFRGGAHFVFRFFPAEWLPALPRLSAWWHLLGDSRTPLCNPGAAIVTQSKRFPLVWPELGVELPAWSRLLPLTCDPRHADTCLSEGNRMWKPALGRVGDFIQMAGVTPEKESRRIARAVRRHPRYWVAQQRFEAVPLEGPEGRLYPCVGIYTLNARVIGAYGRIAPKPLIDHLAQDAAVLVAQAIPIGLNTHNHSHEFNRTLHTVGA